MSRTRASLHSLHPYPCKFPESVVVESLCEGRIVLDPYCGSGTTMLEAAIRGHDVIGVDCNPIALMITRAKLLSLGEVTTPALHSIIEELKAASRNPAAIDADLPNFQGRDHWFPRVARSEFGLIRFALDRLDKDSAEWISLATIASSLVTRFSNQDSETRYVRVDRPVIAGQILTSVVEKFLQYQQWIRERGDLNVNYNLHLGDFGTEKSIESESIDQVITSPPYANTMDYYLYHKQRMNFLGYDFKSAQNLEIGSRYEFSSQKQNPNKWGLDLQLGLESVHRVLKKGAQAIFVIGDSQIAKMKIDASEIISQLARQIGFDFVLRKSEAMSGKSRHFAKAFQAPNKFEHTICLIKR